LILISKEEVEEGLREGGWVGDFDCIGLLDGDNWFDIAEFEFGLG